jgi:hypothetical protein
VSQKRLKYYDWAHYHDVMNQDNRKKKDRQATVRAMFISMC